MTIEELMEQVEVYGTERLHDEAGLYCEADEVLDDIRKTVKSLYLIRIEELVVLIQAYARERIVEGKGHVSLADELFQTIQARLQDLFFPRKLR